VIWSSSAAFSWSGVKLRFMTTNERVGGYTDAAGTPSEPLQNEIEFADAAHRPDDERAKEEKD
jgi:hypothetical protein